jgi:hypothetical protein
MSNAEPAIQVFGTHEDASRARQCGERGGVGFDIACGNAAMGPTARLEDLPNKLGQSSGAAISRILMSR